MSNEDYISATNLVKSYTIDARNRVDVLNSFSFSVKQGEVLALYGPNGCGKSTILSIIAQLIPLDGGKVLVGGRKPSTGDVGCLFQDYRASLFPWMNCAENISFALRVKGVGHRERIKRAQDIAGALQISIELEKYPYQLSGGQQQLVALARALCNSPSALVMDEPFSSLDATIRDRVRKEVLRIIGSTGLTAILVSHNLEDCILSSNRVAFLTPLPARIFRMEDVPLSSERHTRQIHSDKFAGILEMFQAIAVEARGE